MKQSVSVGWSSYNFTGFVKNRQNEHFFSHLCISQKLTFEINLNN